MNELNLLEKLVDSFIANPIIALFALIFLVQSYIQINHLDNINKTLVEIHQDNVILKEYIAEENQSSVHYIEIVENIEDKIDLLLGRN